MSALRTLWRRIVGAVKPAPPAAAPSPAPVTPESIATAWGRILRALGPETDAPPVPLTMPDVLPGVRPPQGNWPKDNGLVLAMDGGRREVAMDAAPGAPAAWGFGDSGTIGPGLAFLGFPYLAQLAQISEYRVPAESLSQEMTRAWVKLKNKGKRDLQDKISEIETRLEALKIRDLFREAALKTEQFGRAHIGIAVKGQDDERSRQLPLDKIEKDTLLGFTCIEPYWLTPYSWNAIDPLAADFYRPQSWFVLGRKTHHTRLLTFIFREVPDLLKPAYDFAGISMTQLMMPYVQRWMRTAKNVNDLINIFSIATLFTDLTSLLQAPEDGGLLNRVQAFTKLRDNRGLMVANKTTEDLKLQNVPLGTLDALQAQSQEHMATPARMPLIKFFGIVPAGLGATSDGEFQSWYDYVRAICRLGFDAHLTRVLQLVQMDMYGEVDPDVVYEWSPLWEPTPKEAGEMRKADADRDTAYIQNSVVSGDEVRDKLRKDPTSGYDGLEGPAPEPPEVAEEPPGGADPEVE